MAPVSSTEDNITMFAQFCGWWYKIALSFSLPGNDSFLTKLKSNKRNYLRAELKEKYLN